MSFDDRTTDRQTDPHAFLLGGVERVEQPMDVFRLHADTTVADRKFDIAAVMPAHPNLQLRLIRLKLFHRIDAVEHQVQQHLLDLHPISQQRRQALRNVDQQCDALPLYLAVCQRHDLSDGIGHADPLLVSGRTLRQGAHPHDDVACAVRVTDHAVDGLPGLFQIDRLGGQPALTGITAGDNGRQRLIDLVGNGRRQFTQLIDPCDPRQL